MEATAVMRAVLESPIAGGRQKLRLKTKMEETGQELRAVTPPLPREALCHLQPEEMRPARTLQGDIAGRIGTASILHLQTSEEETGQEPRAAAPPPRAALCHLQLDEMSPGRTTPIDIAGRTKTTGTLHLQTSTDETGQQPRSAARPRRAALCRLQLQEGRAILTTPADIAGRIGTAWTLHLQTSTDGAGQ